MARKVKFGITTSSLVLHAASALILLSGTVESRQCFWCGPLADQVHRSQRAPSCGPRSNHVTDCDPGYSHCAVVASSPPFVESRYCVKFYQDECYAVYCNTTKSYRMTCPCRGDLCNGPKTEREIEAFAILTKAVSKTKNARIKKRHIRKARGLMHSSIVNAMQANEEDANGNNVENEIDERIKVSDLNETMQADQPAEENVNSENSQTMKHNYTNNATTEMDDAKIIKTTDTSHKHHEMSITTAANPEDNSEHLEVTTVPLTKLTMVPMQTTVEFKSDINSNVKQSVSLPPAEALQQNSESMLTSDKPEATSSEAMTEMTTFSSLYSSPMPTRISRNNGNVVGSNIFILLPIVLKIAI